MRAIINYLFSEANHPTHLSIVKWMWRITLYGMLGGFLFFVFLSFSNLPSLQQLENPRSDEASQILADNGELLGVIAAENRIPITYDSLSPYLVHALIATEDKRFYEHVGIDFEALGRVMVKTVMLQDRSSGGASTITQQLAKLLFTKKPGSGLARVMQKFKEWIIAVRLERKYTKEEILTMYLNKAEFVNNAYGIKAAADTYFSKTPKNLELHEAAMLIGMLQNPSYFNPLRRPELCKKRREIVLNQMVKNGSLTETRYNEVRVSDLGINFRRKSHIDGIATYFREALRQDLKSILSSKECLQHPDGTPYDLYRDGLKVYTTIDPEVQRLAERAMIKHMSSLQKAFWNEWRGKDPWTYKGGSDANIPGVPTRMAALDNSVRATDRYQVLRDIYLGDITRQIESEMAGEGFFHEDDREIDRMEEENSKPGYLEKLVEQQIIGVPLAAQYRKVMNHTQFPRLLNQWRSLQEVVTRDFRRPVRMKVFTYEPGRNFEKDTVMSPLDSIKYHRMFLQTGILAVEPQSGYVKAWVGGINSKYFQYDHIRISRQVGSTFKPFVYAAAIALNRLSPCYTVYDVQQTIEPGDGDFNLFTRWTPRNFNNEYSGRLINLKEGLRKSKNSVSVKLVKELNSTTPIRTLVHAMGIDSSTRYPNGQYRVPKSPAICLGAADLSVMEMTGAFSTFANNGLFVRPTTVLRIEDKTGKIIYESEVREEQAIQPAPNYVMVELLRYAANISGIKSDVGGKTGTTNDFVDGWFMGMTPNLVVGTWVGGEDRWIHFRSSTYGQGARMAKPFFVEFLRQLESAKDLNFDPSKRFFRPPGDLGIILDCSQYTQGGLNLDPTNTGTGKEDQFGDEINQ
ncbi:MAG TPA: transglycosylase domain-containing protein [Haliscomenobacter sp.]|uniref:transglycosylase domain-containing protein n=1 Tax=Haliscomenobacter sp. TaxID=2717303 RepID=UPI002CA05C8D|nr:transglycosylase domain-containing protein [Haliscomenobacter sp.]HOY17933.1 transglycosylase domain-containing protein [Haliscomenobacter sp.]HPH18604.1 transglycosylase domain-containing protein [Haliscomenobacter sp.]